jgi:hypothetical protein
MGDGEIASTRRMEAPAVIPLWNELLVVVFSRASQKKVTTSMEHYLLVLLVN